VAATYNERVIVARMDIRRIDIAVVVSLLLHGILAILPPLTPKPGETSASSPAPFIARIVDVPAPRSEPESIAAAPVAPAPRVTPRRPIVVPKTPPPIAAAVPSDRQVPAEVVPPAPPQPQFDMLAMINARREQRRQVEHALEEREEARSAASGTNDPMAAIKRNLATLNAPNQDGTGGVFQILSKGTRVGEFAFNGFRPDTNRRWREVIEVDAGQGGDVERAMVRRMIELIRSHYEGDFIWRSHRLGKSLTMSARPADQAELEDFLIREFFETPTLAHKQPPGQRYQR
jgi:hypothetical protein